MDDKHKCGNCGKVSSSPITANRKCGHCRNRQSTPARSLPTSDFYKSQTIRMPTVRARMQMSSALQNSSPMRGPISVRSLDSVRPLSQTRQTLNSLANSAIPNRVTTSLRNHSKPEVIHLEDDCSQEMADESQEISTIDIVDNNPSVQEMLPFPIRAIPKYAMFGTHKTQPNQIEFNEDSVRITNVSPNDSSTRIKYHLMIPFVEIQRLLYCKGNTDSMVLIEPTHESCHKIQDCMFLGANSPNGLKLDINSGEPRERYIIVLLSVAMSQRFVQTLAFYSQRHNSRLECQQIDARMARNMLTETQALSVVTARPPEPIPSPSPPLANTPNVTNPSMIESIEPLSANSNDSPSDGSPTAESISSTIAIDDDEEVMEETVEEIVGTTNETQQQLDKVTITYPKGSKMEINLKFN